MQSPEIRLGCNTNAYVPLYTAKQAVEIIKDIGIKFVELSSERELTQALYHDPARFERYYGNLMGVIKKNGQEVIATCSWVRDASWVSERDEDARWGGARILYSLIDMARILGAERIMTPFGTIRGPSDMSEGYIEKSIDNGVEAWIKASKYAAKENEFGPKLKLLEMEAMSYLFDLPTTIEQARLVLNKIRELQKKSGELYADILLRYDVAHAPSKEESTDKDDFNIMGWLNAFPTDIIAFHLKGYKDEEGRAVVPMAGEYFERGREITYGLIDAIESMNELRTQAGASPLKTVDVIIEGIILKERNFERKKTEKANAETIENVKSFFKEGNYEENSKTSLLVKKSFF